MTTPTVVEAPRDTESRGPRRPHTYLQKVDGMALIRAERRRQVEVEGWTPEHDREHGSADLTRAANGYALGDRAHWPWDSRWWKPKDHLSNLIRAGALYLAAAEVRGVEHSSSAEQCAEEIDDILAKARALLAHPATDQEEADRG